MTKMFERKSTSLTISEFYDNYQSNKYNFDVAYQRKSNIWSEDKKSFLIDSILKNYPIPAIFLRPSIDTTNGKTVYDVVDGKQRLETIVSFIENKIPLTDYFAEDEFIDDKNAEVASKIAGLNFQDIQKNSSQFNDYIRQFWTYTLNIEYLYEQDNDLVATVFDRLNRNGEPLTRQELRKAKYANTFLLKVIDNLSKDVFWIEKLKRVRSDRMEDVEFISELFFLVLTNKINDSSQDLLDKFYDEFASDEEHIKIAEREFNDIVNYIKTLNIDFKNYRRLCWTTHLYSLFSLAWRLNKEKIEPQKVKNKLERFYKSYFSKDKNYEGDLKTYKEASSSRTRSATQRNKRLEALLHTCGCQS